MSEVENDPRFYWHWGPFLYRTKITEDQRQRLLEQGKQMQIDYSKTLAGRIKKEYGYTDEQIIQWEKELLPVVNEYLSNLITHYHGKAPEDTSLLNDSVIHLMGLWINFQEKGEYNPIHDHSGDISFVIYIDVPEQIEQEEYTHNGQPNGSISWEFGQRTWFYPRHFDQPGKIREMLQPITMITLLPRNCEIYLFPSYLRHNVAAFDSDGLQRISVSGNITLAGKDKGISVDL